MLYINYKMKEVKLYHKVDEHKVAKINVDKLLDSFKHVEAVALIF